MEIIVFVLDLVVVGGIKILFQVLPVMVFPIKIHTLAYLEKDCLESELKKEPFLVVLIKVSNSAAGEKFCKHVRA